MCKYNKNLSISTIDGILGVEGINHRQSHGINIIEVCGIDNLALDMAEETAPTDLREISY